MERRLLTFAFLSIIIWMLSMQYLEKKYPHPKTAESAQTGQVQPGISGSATESGAGDGVTATTGTTQAPVAANALPPGGAVPGADAYVAGPTVAVKTSVYDILLSTNGAVPVRWDVIDPHFAPRDLETVTTGTAREYLIDPKLVEHPELPHPFQIVLQELNSRYYTEFNRMVYAHEQLDDSAAGLVHRFTSPPNAAGLVLVKTWTFNQDSYKIRLDVELKNNGSSNIDFGGSGRGLGISVGPGLGGDANAAYEPATAYSSVDAVVNARDTFLHETISKIDASGGNTTLGRTITFDETRDIAPILWGGIANKYFLAAVVPDGSNTLASAQALLDNRVLGTLAVEERSIAHYPIIELYSAPFKIAPGQSTKFGYTVYVGPKQKQLLADAGHELHRAMFHTSNKLIRFLCLFLLPILYWLQTVFGNWGIAIITLTIIVRLATLPLVHKGMKSQAKMTQEMAKIKPLLDKVNEKYKNDPQRKQQETFKIYKEHNINPLGALKGCIWMVIQLPIFIGLYALLYQVIDLRGAEFLWIRDLSQPEQLFHLPFSLPFLGQYFNLLPFIVALTQMLTSKFMQTPASDPQQEQMQKMMMYFMPVMILAITYRFPAGLMLYWLVSNAWQVMQQIYVNKVIKRPAAQASAAA